MKIIENRGGYIYAQNDNPYNFQEVIELAKEVASKCLAENQTKVLVNLSNMRGKLQPMDKFNLGVQGAMIFRKVAQVTVVYDKSQIDGFAETVAINRGMNTRIFSSLEAATEWLGVNVDTSG